MCFKVLWILIEPLCPVCTITELQNSLPPYQFPVCHKVNMLPEPLATSDLFTDSEVPRSLDYHKNGILQFVAFTHKLLPQWQCTVKTIRILLRLDSSLLFVTEYCSVVCMHQRLFIHSPTERCLTASSS